MQQLLTILVTIYGIGGALSSLLQVRRMLQTGSSKDVSIPYFIISSGGYLIWLAYGIVAQDVALIIVDAIGICVSSITLTTIVTLRHKAPSQQLVTMASASQIGPESSKLDIFQVFNRTETSAAKIIGQ